jgi:hypothetical protein
VRLEIAAVDQEFAAVGFERVVDLAHVADDVVANATSRR